MPEQFSKLDATGEVARTLANFLEVDPADVQQIVVVLQDSEGVSVGTTLCCTRHTAEGLARTAAGMLLGDMVDSHKPHCN